MLTGTLNDVNYILKHLYFIPTEDFNQDFNIQVYIENSQQNFLEGKIEVYGTSVPDVPVNLILSNSKVDKSAAVGTIIGMFTVTDPDLNETHTFELTEGSGDEHNNYF